ncbi:MAG: DNA polymerase [Bacteroides sp.]|nr:DNA polymerase [Bacteroides sp.]
MTTLYIDIETYSPVDLKKAGVYKYASHPDFDVILTAYAVDDGPARVCDGLNDEVRALLADPSVVKVAHNAMFERVCLSIRYAKELPHLAQHDWRCSMVLATAAGYPPALRNAAEALRLPVHKMEEGADLIKFFCMPYTTKAGTVRNLPAMHPDKWEVFKRYCTVDVEVCRLVWKACRYAEYEGIWEEYMTDADINDRGVGIDRAFVRNARRFKDNVLEEAQAEFNRLTGVDNAKSCKQLQGWLASQGVQTTKTDKAAMADIAARKGGMIEQALAVRENLNKTSLAKYDRMEEMDLDGRIYGLFQFYGASRTGRFAGRGLQPQNFPRNYLRNLDAEREEVSLGNYTAWRTFHERPADTLSQLLRTAFVPAPGCRFAVADYSAIEARVLAWLAGEKWRQDVFAGNGRIYEATASAMFRVPLASITKDSPLRARGKIADLALGYGGGTAALIRMGALRQGLTEAELPGIVKRWREACPAIVRVWGACECAAASAIKNPGKTYRLLGNANAVAFRVVTNGGTVDPDTMQAAGGIKSLEITLPSGRRLYYVSPSLELNGNRYRLRYYEEDDLSKRWIKKDTYGGKLTENIVSGTCRDLLTEALDALTLLDGIRVVMHVHDEVVCEVDEGYGPPAEATLNAIQDKMTEAPEWAQGLPLAVSGFVSKYYKKD